MAAAVDGTGVPVLRFDADWSVTQSAPLVAGQQAVLRYAPARLPRCRAIYHGEPAWAIDAMWAADGGPSRDGAIFASTPVVDGHADVPFVVPIGGDLAVWFLDSDEFGCADWDSDYGRNFHFAIQPGSDAILHFTRDFRVSVEGALHAGRPVTIDYDLHRLPDCRQDYNGYQTWDVIAHARFDGGPIVDTSLTTAQSDGGRVQSPVTLDVPAGAHELELWFENTDRTGCDRWDSDYARNFHFTIN